MSGAIITYFIGQLEKKYPDVLRDRITGAAFEPINLRGGKKKPETTVSLHESIRQFRTCEKQEMKNGWVIEWENWTSRKFGNQIWPANIVISTLDDYLFLTGKQQDFALFEKQLNALRNWRPSIVSWLAERPAAVVEYADSWTGICAVVDYLINNDTAGQYLRSLPVPVHTKFIESHEWIITALLRYLLPEKYTDATTGLEQQLGLKRKPVLFTLRWLDSECGLTHGFTMDVLGLPPDTLQKMHWQVKEIWLVENETALYILPRREKALAIWTRGKAIELLAGIPFFDSANLFYWGDMDEDGYFILAQCRKMYAHAQSCLMSEEALQLHRDKMSIQPASYRAAIPEGLTAAELAAFNLLAKSNGRIEQEQFPQKFIQDVIASVV